ncbi:MAG: cation:proton antiporter [Actinobacteria bacterium]|nr:cation:proton antiporter [Actinomycetota bacterium]
MNIERVLVELLVILLAARLAAEVSERLRQPAVLGEILLGIVIGPSALKLVHQSDALRLLGEIGVILLLFEVGRQMDLKELGRVGGASLRVATIGVIVPMALGFVAMRAAGIAGSPALFLAAGITATSVGITARVFGDLRALGTSEARTVLGAAVADDVIGLLILTVVVRTASGKAIAVGSLAGIIAVAIGFVAIATLVGSWIAPKFLDRVSHSARTDGTIMAFGLIIALGFARLASAARLAPIVGAFVAGLAVGRSDVADDLDRRLTPLGHFFIPIFFLQIGIDANIRVFMRGSVLGVAAILCLVAVAGKIVAGAGVRRGSGDRLLVGVGMIPRGEVGLIFASLGLARGVLNARTYGVLLLVVLVTTLVTPPWLRRRVVRARRAVLGAHVAVIEPEGGWLRTGDDEVELAAQPPPVLAARVGLEAAAACAERRPGRLLSDWLSAETPIVEWDEQLRHAFFALLGDGNERSWRFLDVTGLLRSVLRPLEEAIHRRPRDPFDLDPAGSLRFNTLYDLRTVIRSDDPAAEVWKRSDVKEALLLAALVRSVTERSDDAAALARRIATTMALVTQAVDDTEFLSAERHVIPAAAARPDMGSEEQALDLASYIEDRSRADGLYLLAVAENAMEPWERERLDELHGIVLQALEDADLTGKSARDIVEQRQEAVALQLGHMPEKDLRKLMWAAPRRYLLTQAPDTIVRHIRMIEKPLGKFEARLVADESPGHESWSVHVAVQDRRGVLAAIAGAFAARQVSVEEAQIATWRSGVAVDVFKVTAPSGTDWDGVRRTIEGALAHDGANGETPAPIEGRLEIDNLGSPWHTIVEIQSVDRSGLLYRVAAAMSRAGLQIHQATVSTRHGVAVDTFWVTGRTGAKLDEAGERDLRDAFAGKARRRWWAMRKNEPKVKT